MWSNTVLGRPGNPNAIPLGPGPGMNSMNNISGMNNCNMNTVSNNGMNNNGMSKVDVTRVVPCRAN